LLNQVLSVVLAEWNEKSVRSAAEEMRSCVRALDEHITLARLFIFSVEKDAASHTL
jgi:hypothetical protein